ncbi:hypothetical protein POUND7_004406, partial [Theobroma cacao]
FFISFSPRYLELGNSTTLLASFSLSLPTEEPNTFAGTVAASTPRKSENNDSEKGEIVSNDQTKPIVAFSKPPPQPPLLGPLVALSLLETWSRRDGDDS